ncbi:MAG: Com family DNA-binding transcriptional regulator [Selenomonadales bacterium]|nr:Com family DNA-binding transcriptional regulator [Selenomonadales bacterium]
MEVIQLKKRKSSMPEHRCCHCRRLLFYGEVKRIEIKCPKCGRILELTDENKT